MFQSVRPRGGMRHSFNARTKHGSHSITFRLECPALPLRPRKNTSASGIRIIEIIGWMSTHHSTQHSGSVQHIAANVHTAGHITQIAYRMYLFLFSLWTNCHRCAADCRSIVASAFVEACVRLCDAWAPRGTCPWNRVHSDSTKLAKMNISAGGGVASQQQQRQQHADKWFMRVVVSSFSCTRIGWYARPSVCRSIGSPENILYSLRGMQKRVH